MADTTSNTLPCSKCGTEIATDIDRCPQCAHEPGNSILSVLIFWLIALPLGLLFGIIIAVSLIAPIAGGMTVGEAFGAFFAGAIPGAIPFWYIRRYWRRKRKGPTE